MIRIGIVDDKLINRETIRQNLGNEHKNIRVCMEAVNGEDFLAQIQTMNEKDRPHLVLMDLDMPVLGGIETIAVATLRFPDIKFLVLTIFDDNEKIFEAIKAGASGYLLKDDSAAMLQDAIINVHYLNGAPMSPAIARKTLQWLKESQQPFTSEKKQDTILDILSEREQEILKLLVEGKDYRLIAATLFISPQTVRTHISRIYEKLHINSKAQAILLAHKYKWPETRK